MNDWLGMFFTADAVCFSTVAGFGFLATACFSAFAVDAHSGFAVVDYSGFCCCRFQRFSCCRQLLFLMRQQIEAIFHLPRSACLLKMPIKEGLKISDIIKTMGYGDLRQSLIETDF